MEQNRTIFSKLRRRNELLHFYCGPVTILLRARSHSLALTLSCAILLRARSSFIAARSNLYSFPAPSLRPAAVLLRARSTFTVFLHFHYGPVTISLRARSNLQNFSAQSVNCLHFLRPAISLFRSATKSVQSPF